MVERMYLGIPRREIPWYPQIDYERCIGCLTCVKHCPHNVYGTEGNPAKPVVVNPYNCIVGCSSCAKLCPSEAIKFPSKDELREILKNLRGKYGLG
ncbi:MAG: ferredoxin family protein [Candidatus Bathyarchaeia archaeon]|nr:ferredoxin family protein [Candidatus Bathyarchaeota archaeon]